MEKKIDQNSGFEGFSIKNLQQSIGFWRNLASNNYFARSLSQINTNIEKKISEEIFNVSALPRVSIIPDCTQKSFEQITQNLTSSDLISPKLLLLDNSELAIRIKKLLVLSGFEKKGVLPSINLLSNFESHQANRPVDKDSGLINSESKKLIDLVEKIPFFDNHFVNRSMSSLELASDWLKVIDRWEWLEESWKILGSPKIPKQNSNLEFGSLQYLFLLKNALQDKSNAALWHSRQFKLALSKQFKKAQFANAFSGAVMVLTELPDPLIFAKALILARQKISSWKIFLISHPLTPNKNQDIKNFDSWSAWERNFPLIWPEAFEVINKTKTPNNFTDFDVRRGMISSNSKIILKEFKKSSDFTPLRCIEVKSLESMTEVLMIQIKTLLNKKIPKIGIVAQDRRATRRLIAKLNQHEIDVDDTAGWSLNTSVVSLSIINLAKIISGKVTSDDFYYWINIPLVVRALITKNFLTQSAHAELIQSIKKYKSHNDILRLLNVDLYNVLTNNDSGKLAGSLMLTLNKIGIEQELLSDSAGQVALKVCRKLEIDLMGKPITNNHFLNLLEWRFSNNNFALKSVDSSIKLISFQQAIWDPPDVVLVIGGTSQYMPNSAVSKFVDSALWEKTAAYISSKEVELHRLKIFIGVLKLKIPVILIGQSEENKDFVSWSRWIERIRLMVPNLLQLKIFSKFAISHKKYNSKELSNVHPSVHIQDYPDSISVSHIKSLIECPYKFFWQSIFKLKKSDYFGDNEEYRETGIGLHLLMEYIGNISSDSPNYCKSKSTKKNWFDYLVFKIEEMKNHRLISWETSLNLRARVGHLSKWCANFFDESSPLMIESKVSARLPKLPILIKGKVDRVEQKNSKEKTKILIDYKSSKVIGLKNESQTAQILIYAWLLGVNKVHITEAGYLCITNKESKWLVVEAIYKQKELISKLCSTLLSLKKGFPIKPTAAKSGLICKSCSVKNVCRKDEWMSNKNVW